VQRRQRVTKRGLSALAIAVATSVISAALTGCSPGIDYPAIFPAAHDLPPPRLDKTMDANQLQQATETLITERDRLSVQAQGAGGGKAATPAAADAAKKPAATATSPAPTAGRTVAGSANAQGAANDAQAAGAETKP